MRTSELLETEEKVEVGVNRPKQLAIAIKFLSGWFLSLCIIAVLALLINIDWAKPKMESIVSENMHRPVKLGHLRWHLGLNGLTILTRSMAVLEPDGSKFMTARGSNVGIAVTPLLAGKVIIKHMQIDHPEIWAVKLKPGAWNFEDLLAPGVEIKFMQIDTGIVHLKDATRDATVKEPITLSDLNFKFNWPQKKKKLPIYLSLALPGSDATKSENYLRVEGFGEAQDKDIINTKYSFKLTGRDIKSGDLRQLMAVVADDPKLKKELVDEKLASLTGMVSVKAQATGSIPKGFAADIETTVKDFDFTNSNLGSVKTKDIDTRGNINISPTELSWQGLAFNIGGVELKSHGALKDWQKLDSSYKFDLTSDVPDISKITKAVDLSGLKENKDGQLLKLIKTATLSGKAFIDIKVTGNADKTQLLTQLEAEGLPLGQVLKEIAPELAPGLALAGIGDKSVIRGHFEAHPGRKLKIQGGQIAIPDSLIKLEGEIDLLRDSMDIKFALEDFSLKRAWSQALNDPSTLKVIEERITRTSAKNLLVDGYVKAEGKIVKSKRGIEIEILSALRQGGLATADKGLSASNINGNFDFKNGVLKLNSLGGKVGPGGHFDLSGQVFELLSGKTRHPTVDLTFNGSNVSFSQLSSFMGVFGLVFPAITEDHLTGRVKELCIKLSGNPEKPQVYLKAVPEDISYRPPGLSRSLKAISGSIIYDRGNINLQEVGIVSHGMKLTTSVRIDDTAKSAVLRDVHVKSDGIDIADIDYYLSSPVLPAPLRRAYRDLLNTYKVKNLHGKIYGDLVVVPQGTTDVNVEGVVGCYSVGAVVSQLALPLERIAGTIAASGDELLIQDLSGYARNTQFEMNGYVKDYKSKTPSWKTELRATIAPNEFLDLVPKLTESVSNGKLKIYSTGALALRAKIDGNPHKNEVIFSAHSDSDNHLKVSTPMLTLNQPGGDELSLDGSMSLTDIGMVLNKTNLLLGPASLTTKGEFMWGKTDQPLSFTVISPNPVPVGTLIGLVDPTFQTKNMKGTIDGFAALEGPLRHPRLTGKISLDHISNLDFKLYDLTGTISTDNTSAKDSDPYAISLARVDIDHFRLHKLLVADIGGFIQVQAPEPTAKDELPKSPQVILKDMTARVAGGLIKLDGHCDVEKHQVGINAYLVQLHLEELMDRLLNAPNEVSGPMDGEIHLTTSGADDKQMLANLEGTGHILVTDGIVARFGQLQNKLTQANLLQQGILGFNLNNLLQSVAPVRSGEFNQLQSRFQIYKGVLNLKELRFSGDDLRLWGGGAVNLPENTINVEIAGTIPRVTKSRLGGALGELTRGFTISSLINKATFGALENLPSLPIIGDIASDKPRGFAFQVQAPMGDPKLVTKSIEKSFKFLPNKQAASAHPVPGL